MFLPAHRGADSRPLRAMSTASKHFQNTSLPSQKGPEMTQFFAVSDRALLFIGF